MAFDYKTRLPNQFSDAENLQAVIDVAAEMFEESNAILETLRDDMTIDLAAGVWLDEIGDIVGIYRASQQVEDAAIFTYCDDSESPGLPALGFLSDDGITGGQYVGIDGLPSGVEFVDADYRDLITAKVLSTYSGDTIPEIYTWIKDVFGIESYVYNSGPAEIGVDLAEYLTHTQRRILETYAPRAAGVGFCILSWPALLPPGPTEEDDMSYRFIETIPAGTTTIGDTEESVHIVFYGTATEYTIIFDAASTFTTRRLFRLTNQSSEPITVQSFDGTVIETLLPNAVMQCTLSDLTGDAGDWLFLQHVTGDGEVI